MYTLIFVLTLISLNSCISNANPNYDPKSGQYVLPQHLQPLSGLQIDTINYGQSANALLSPVELKYVLARTTEIHNLELYDNCKSTGKLDVISIGRDELFFLNMSCANYYTSNPLARETLGVTIKSLTQFGAGQGPQVISPTVNFTITNVVENGFHYEIHEGIVADGDLINATVYKVKTFAESDFQKGCAQEPGLQFIRLLRADITITAPFGDYSITCESTKRPGMNFYTPGIVAPEVLATPLKHNNGLQY